MIYFGIHGFLLQARAESRHIEMDSIEKGIVNLICQLGIRKLVMGAAADMHYSKYNHLIDFSFCFSVPFNILTIIFFFISIYIHFEPPKGRVNLNDSHWMCPILGKFFWQILHACVGSRSGPYRDWRLCYLSCLQNFWAWN